MHAAIGWLVACAFAGALTPSGVLRGNRAAPASEALPTAAPNATGANGAADRAAGHPVMLVLFDDFSSPGVVAFVRRTGAGEGPTLIGIKRRALTPGLLYTTMRLVPSVVRQHADGRTISTTIHISRRQRLVPVPVDKGARLEELMSRLVSAPQRELPRLGRHPVLEVTDDL